MTPEDLAGMAAAVAQLISEATATLRREQDDALATVRRHCDNALQAVIERAQRAEMLAEQLQRDLEVVRARADEPPLRDALLDAEGVVHLVLRGGDTVRIRMPDVRGMVAAEVARSAGEAESRHLELIRAEVARGMHQLGLAPPWKKVAAYGPGALVSCYIGRTYRLRDGVQASIGQEPGDHPEVWERIGSFGLRVLKSKPAELAPGDVFAESDARFIHDGVITTLLSPKAIKLTDVERGLKPVHGTAQAALDAVQRAEQRLDELSGAVRRTTEAANEATTWIQREGQPAAEQAARAHALAENSALLIESPAMRRIVDRADEIDDLLDREAG
jgi:hypothetical protein